jgi:cytochrome c553
MRFHSGKGQVSNLLITCILLLLLIATSLSALASGQGHHHHTEETSEHMQSMMAVKKEIPEEYQIMERVPILPTEGSLQKGKELFLQNCSVCHGEKGDGQGPAAAALNPPPANFLEMEHSAIYGPGEKYWIIGNGSEETGMPAFPQLTPLDRWHLVNHIFHLQESESSEVLDLFSR